MTAAATSVRQLTTDGLQEKLKELVVRAVPRNERRTGSGEQRARTIAASQTGAAGWTESFNVAFRAGGVMGFSLCSMALVILYGLLCAFESYLGSKTTGEAKELFECIAGYGLGGSFNSEAYSTMYSTTASSTFRRSASAAEKFVAEL